MPTVSLWYGVTSVASDDLGWPAVACAVLHAGLLTLAATTVAGYHQVDGASHRGRGLAQPSIPTVVVSYAVCVLFINAACAGLAAAIAFVSQRGGIWEPSKRRPVRHLLNVWVTLLLTHLALNLVGSVAAFTQQLPGELAPRVDPHAAVRGPFKASLKALVVGSWVLVLGLMLVGLVTASLFPRARSASAHQDWTLRLRCVLCCVTGRPRFDSAMKSNRPSAERWTDQTLLTELADVLQDGIASLDMALTDVLVSVRLVAIVQQLRRLVRLHHFLRNHPRRVSAVGPAKERPAELLDDIDELVTRAREELPALGLHLSAQALPADVRAGECRAQLGHAEPEVPCVPRGARETPLRRSGAQDPPAPQHPGNAAAHALVQERSGDSESSTAHDSVEILLAPEDEEPGGRGDGPASPRLTRRGSCGARRHDSPVVDSYDADGNLGTAEGCGGGGAGARRLESVGGRAAVAGELTPSGLAAQLLKELHPESDAAAREALAAEFAAAREPVPEAVLQDALKYNRIAMATYGAGMYAWERRSSADAAGLMRGLLSMPLLCLPGCCCRPDAEEKLQAISASMVGRDLSFAVPADTSVHARIPTASGLAAADAGDPVRSAPGGAASSAAMPAAEGPEASEDVTGSVSLVGTWMQSLRVTQQLNREAFLRISGLEDRHLIYDCAHNGAAESAPLFVTVDSARRTIIIAIRGSFSLADILTDTLCTPAPLRPWMDDLPRTQPETPLSSCAASCSSPQVKVPEDCSSGGERGEDPLVNTASSSPRTAALSGALSAALSARLGVPADASGPFETGPPATASAAGTARGAGGLEDAATPGPLSGQDMAELQRSSVHRGILSVARTIVNDLHARQIPAKWLRGGKLPAASAGVTSELPTQSATRPLPHSVSDSGMAEGAAHDVPPSPPAMASMASFRDAWAPSAVGVPAWFGSAGSVRAPRSTQRGPTKPPNSAGAAGWPAADPTHDAFAMPGSPGAGVSGRSQSPSTQIFSSARGAVRRLGSQVSRMARTPLRVRTPGASQTDAEPWRIVVTGHSLGAGVAALVSLWLRLAFPYAQVHAWLYGCPAALMSRAAAAVVGRWCTQVVVGKDVVARLTMATFERLRRDMVQASVHFSRSKRCAAALHRRLKSHRLPRVEALCGALADFGPPSEEARGYLREFEALSRHRGSEAAARTFELMRGFVSPGRIVFLRPTPQYSNQSWRERSHDAVWISSEDLVREGILVSAHMIVDHLPDVSFHVLKKVLRSKKDESLQHRDQTV